MRPGAKTSFTIFVIALLLACVQAHYSQEHSRIVGGDEVEPHSIPWQVAIKIRGSLDDLKCGGTIICPTFVMTSASCMMYEHYRKKDVYVRVHNRREDMTEDRKHEVKQTHVHPNRYDPIGMQPRIDYNYAILELKSPISLQAGAYPIYLPVGNEEFNQQSLFLVSGWGVVKEMYEGKPDKLRGVTIPWISPADCQNALVHVLYNLNITSRMMCTGDLEKGGIGWCSGDFGGPLAWLDPVTHQVKLAGVASFITTYPGCSGPDSPLVASDMRDQLEWVRQVTGNCNEETCHKKGKCIKKEDLAPSVIKRFDKVTPH